MREGDNPTVDGGGPLEAVGVAGCAPGAAGSTASSVCGCVGGADSSDGIDVRVDRSASTSSASLRRRVSVSCVRSPMAPTSVTNFDQLLLIGEPSLRRLIGGIQARIERLQRFSELRKCKRELLCLFLQHPQLGAHLLMLAVLRRGRQSRPQKQASVSANRVRVLCMPSLNTLLRCDDEMPASILAHASSVWPMSNGNSFPWPRVRTRSGETPSDGGRS